MADTDRMYDEKFKEMQQYMPFLEKIIEKLKVNNNNVPDNPRKAQLQKMEMLQSLLLSKGKKLKMETLLKCEGVLKKLHTKMEKHHSFFQKSPQFAAASANRTNSSNFAPISNTVPIDVEIVDITGPSSPPASPTSQPIVPIQPVVIPTERRSPLSMVVAPTPKPAKITTLESRGPAAGRYDHVLPESYSRSSSHSLKDRDHRIEFHSKTREVSAWDKSKSNKSNDKIFDRRGDSRDNSFTSNSTASVETKHSSQSSHGSIQHDISMQQFRNPEPQFGRGPGRYSWRRPLYKQDHLDHRNHGQHSHEHVAHGRSSTNSPYPTEESWDDHSNETNARRSHPPIGAPIEVIDLIHESPSPEPAAFDDIIYKYKKPNSGPSTIQKSDKNIFNRLGDKIEEQRYKNFNIHVKNDRMKPQSSTQPSVNSVNPVPPHPPKVPTPLADVLSSPPLTANDISMLLNESVDNTFESASKSISEIGTRRTTKPETPAMITTPTSSLDMVRKKFAMITKNSPNYDSPLSPTCNSPQQAAAAPTNLQNERIALKYNPHPRVERNSLSSNEGWGGEPSGGTNNPNVHNHHVDGGGGGGNFNVLPAINPYDPRLKKSTLQSVPLMNLPVVPSVPLLNPLLPLVPPVDRIPKPIVPVADQGDARSTPYRPHEFHSNEAAFHSQRDPRSLATTTITTHQPHTPRHPTNYEEENWDSEPDLPPAPSFYKPGCSAPSASTSVAKFDPRIQRNSTIPARSSFVEAHRSSAATATTTTTTTQSKGYSSEENWDSDPEPSLGPKIVHPISNSMPKFDPRIRNAEIAARQTFADRRPKNTATRPGPSETGAIPMNSAKGGSHPPQPPCNNARFSAALNDKTERMKYFESKKQKHVEPRTYAEFKEAKARAAAEEAARKMVAEEPKTPKPKSAENSHEDRTKHSKDMKETAQQRKPANKNEKVVPATTCVSDTNLDKMYRSTSMLSNDLPKITSSFKIPKKHTAPENGKSKAAETPEQTKTQNSENKANPKKSVDSTKAIIAPPKDNQKKTTKKDSKLEGGAKETKAKSDIMEEKSADVVNPDIPKKQPKKASKLEGAAAKEMKNDKETKNGTGGETPAADIVKEDIPKKQSKKGSTAKEAKTKNDATKEVNPAEVENQDIQKNQPEPETQLEGEAKEMKPKNENVQEKDEQIKSNTDPADVAIREDESLKTNTEETDLDNSGEWKVIDEVSTDDGKSSEDASKISIWKVIDEVAGSSTEDETCQNKKPSEKDDESKPEPKKMSPIELKPLPRVAALLQPKRILKRRCTMIAYASAPEVDKEKIHSANALLFEDIQNHNRVKQKQAARKSKNLADMFQKTDDNCTISTQNIISGKRRTRTTVNFNEVQQTQAIFKHRLTPDTKKEAKESDLESSKIEAKPVTIAKQENSSAKKSPTPAGGKKKPGKGGKGKKAKVIEQSSTVSSTTTSTSSETNAITKLEPPRNEVEEENEPSSSAKSTNPTPTPLDEEDRKQEWLEGFVKDITNPDSNHELIFGLLGQILSTEKLEQVKKILESATDDNGSQQAAEENETEEVTEQPEVESVQDKKAVKSKTPVGKVAAAKKMPATRRKRPNELERLNEDIRNMFISKGVITATGRRMCTLAAVADAVKSPESTASGTSRRQKEEKSNKAAPEAANVNEELLKIPTPRIRKSKVVISPLNLNKLRRSMRVKLPASDDLLSEDEKAAADGEADDDLLNKPEPPAFVKPTTSSKGAKTPEVEAEPTTAETSPKRKMPVLKPNTPIKLVEEEEQLREIEEKAKLRSGPRKRKLEKPDGAAAAAAQAKPCPKSKKKHPIVETDSVTSEDSEESIKLSHLKIRLKSDSDHSACEQQQQQQHEVIKNTNPDWHSQSKYAHWCVLCDAKYTYLAIHYKEKHNNSENYSSRIAPSILEQFKENKLNTPAFGTSRFQKNLIYWFHRCPFCLQHNSIQLRNWMEHFSTHTGEYSFECSKCHKAGNKPIAIGKHIERYCPGATLIRHNYTAMPMCQKILKAHICHLCNFLQLSRLNLDSHYVKQHGMDPAEVSDLGYSITLIDANGVTVVDEKKAVKLQAAAIEKYAQEPLIIDDASSVEVDQVKTDRAKRKNSKDIFEESSSEAPVLNDLFNDDAVSESEVRAAGVDSTIPQQADETNRVATETSETPSRGDTNEIDMDIIKDEDEEEFIAISQNEVLAAAAKAEADEKARQEALRSNIFLPTRSTTDSPTIECLTQSLRTIEEEEQLQQMAQREHASQGGAPMSMAERLSQRFKDIQGRVTQDKDIDTDNTNTDNVIPVEDPLSIPTESGNSLQPEETSTSGATSITIDDDNNANNTKPKQSAGDLVEEEKNSGQDTEDDSNWEDIEICETAPNSASGTNSLNMGPGKEKNKKKKIFPSLSRLYASITTNKKGANKGKRTSGSVSKARSTTESSASESIQATDSNQSTARSQRSDSITDLLPQTADCNESNSNVPKTNVAGGESLEVLNDISAILEANFSSLDAQSIFQQMDMVPTDSICIDVGGQQQSIQDALEFVAESTDKPIAPNAEPTINTNPLQTIINRIQNLGYSRTSDTGSCKFYCLSEKCTFLFSNESIGLESHYMSEHPDVKWNGFCFMCKQNVEPVDPNQLEFPISKEMKHMLEAHIEGSTQQLPAAEESKDNNEPVEEDPAAARSESRPRIKLRRLTGDCLSSTPTALSTPEPSEFLNDISNMSLTDLLRAEPRPPNLKKRPENNFNNSMNTFAQHSTSNDSPACSDLFKNVGSDFMITAVHSGSSMDPILSEMSNNAAKSTSTRQLEVSNVVSSKDTNVNSKGIQQNDVSLPKISNVCSLNTSAQAQTRGNQWQKRLESDRPELTYSGEDSLEVSYILQNACDKSNDFQNESSRDNDMPTVVAETLPVSTATSGQFLITQTVSAQYENENGSTSMPQLGFNISIASKAANSSSTPTTSTSTPTPTPAVDQQRTSSGTSNTGTGSGRSQFKCMGIGCKFVTRVPVAMSEHLRFHERRNFSTNREYLRCSLCSNIADDVEVYIKHSEASHSIQLGIEVSNANDSSSTTTTTLTQKIQSILKGVGQKKSATNEKSSTGSSESSNSTPPPTSRHQLEETIKEIVESTGLSESALYRCVIEGCKTPLTESIFHSHLVYHLTTLGTVNVNSFNYKCPHCSSVYHRPNGVKAHIRCHARHTLFCYLCMATAVNSAQMVKHFCEKHWKVSNIHSTPLLKSSTDETVYYLAHESPLTQIDSQQFGEKLIIELQRKKAATKTSFRPSELDLLPLQPIFRKEIFCAVCLYKTKVRTNMYRHLQLHRTTTSGSGAQLHVASVDPVNPMPCLNSSERHFDKMCNLASSSLVTGNPAKPPFKITYVYVPEARRHTCGVPGCKYLTVSEDIYRFHLNALHSDLQQYHCPFCKEEICSRGLAVERIAQHLRFHGQKLYQCEECDYLHYMKTVVERHINDRHATQRVNLVTHYRTIENVAEGSKTTHAITGKKFKEQSTAKPASLADLPAASQTPNPTTRTKSQSSNMSPSDSQQGNSKQKWECDLCKHRTATHNQMIHHCNVKHGCKHQYQCVHCPFGSTQFAHILSHIDEKHPAKTREARYIFHKIFSSAQENEADTKPLWQRDDPKRIRHIRGILMEDEEESEEYRKRLCLDEENDDGDDVATTDAVENNAENTAKETEEILKPFIFACFHCNFHSADLVLLKTKHWQNLHNRNVQNSKPFQFHVRSKLRCSQCRNFIGTHKQIQVHMQNVHNTRNFVAADATKPNSICGYCDFEYERISDLINHHRIAQHKPHDMKSFTSTHLKAINSRTTIETFVQCTLCSKLFSSRMAIVEHERVAHKGEENFSFKELRNHILYRCVMCEFSSIDELTTLRHMIDHYSRFQQCHFCSESQSSFNAYMQHYYSEHRQEIDRFSTIYPLKDIAEYLMKVLVIFPNGLVIDKRNLSATSYGSDDCIRELYKEIRKTSQEPPIPRLSIARLVARKSIEAKQSSRNSSPNPPELESHSRSSLSTAAAMQLADDRINKSLNELQKHTKKIAKRRQTVAFGSKDEFASNLGLSEGGPNFRAPKKRKTSEATTSVPPPTFSEIITEDTADQTVVEPYSFYGNNSEPEDLSKIYTKVAIGGLDTPLSIDKFKLLFEIDARVHVERLNVDLLNKKQNEAPDNYQEYRNVKKACPASLKHKYA